MHEPVEVTLTGEGTPSALLWDGTEYRVVDMPTPVEFDLYFVTHPPPPRVGWRFTGRSSCYEVRVFDVLRSAGRVERRLLHAYK